MTRAYTIAVFFVIPFSTWRNLVVRKTDYYDRNAESGPVLNFQFYENERVKYGIATQITTYKII